MDFVREYWWAIVVVVAALVLAFILLRPRQSVRLTETAPVRPHMAYAKRPPEGRGLTGEAAAATSDVTGEIIGAQVHRKLDGVADDHDDLCVVKGIGPKLDNSPRACASKTPITSANSWLTEAEIERLDEQLGAFSGRITRDRIVEQADYLARNDIDGFEQRFGKL